MGGYGIDDGGDGGDNDPVDDGYDGNTGDSIPFWQNKSHRNKLIYINSYLF